MPARAPSGDRDRRRSDRACHRDRPRPARPVSWCCSTTMTASAKARAPSAFPSARSRYATGWASATRYGGKGRHLAARQGVPGGRARSTMFDLLPEGGDKNPAFINLQQYYVEAYLVDRAQGDSTNWSRSAGRNEVTDRRAAWTTSAVPDHRHAGRTLRRSTLRLCDRLRRCAHARPRAPSWASTSSRPGLPGPVPDRRRER